MSDIQLYRYSTSISCNMQDAALACQDFLPGFVDGREADARLAVAFQRAAVSGPGLVCVCLGKVRTHREPYMLSGRKRHRRAIAHGQDLPRCASRFFQVPKPIKRTDVVPEPPS